MDGIKQSGSSGYNREEHLFRLAVITLPSFFDGEADHLEGMLAAGLPKLHIRKPGGEEKGIERLLDRLHSRWAQRLVLHGDPSLAERYGIPQIHCTMQAWKEGAAARGLVSASFHSWQGVIELGAGLEYAFLSPLFDSISKPGYLAGPGLLKKPAGSLPCKIMGLGGIDKDTVLAVVDNGWDGAVLLGWIWEDPNTAVKRYEEIQRIIDKHGKQ